MHSQLNIIYFFFFFSTDMFLFGPQLVVKSLLYLHQHGFLLEVSAEHAVQQHSNIRGYFFHHIITILLHI